MSTHAEHAEPLTRRRFIADLVELTKPRITFLVLFTAYIGIALAPIAIPATQTLACLIGLVATVGGVNALNMYIERDVDKLMTRTANRPLPRKRLQPKVALAFGILLSAAGVTLVTLGVNLISGLLTLLAVVSYVLLYTPLKQFTPSALYVGAVPGALPPLIGWTAATGSIELPGLVLFAIMFWWQIPHFLAIALFRKDDYAAAGLLTLPVVKGNQATKLQIIIGLLCLIPTSLVLIPLEIVGSLYFACAIGLGALFLFVGVQGLVAENVEAWARRLFLVSLLYLTILFAVLLFPAL